MPVVLDGQISNGTNTLAYRLDCALSLVKAVSIEEDGLPLTAQQLRNSSPFDWERRLRGESGDELLAYFIAMLAAHYPRARIRSVSAASKHKATVNGILANIVAVTLNRIDATRFLSMSFNGNDYAHSGLTLKSAQELRDYLTHAGLVDLKYGYRFEGIYAGFSRSSLTRLRATDTLRDLLARYDVTGRSSRSLRDELVRHNRRPLMCGLEDAAITSSREVLARVNALLGAAHISLADEDWLRGPTEQASVPKSVTKDKSHLRHGGDEGAVTLYRVFTNGWHRGGRLYGGWWINASKVQRKRILIDGEETQELDYRALHPALLRAKVQGAPLIDAYVLPGWPLETRDLGKSTFMRLLNRTRRGALPLSEIKRPSLEVKHLLPSERRFVDYMAAYRLHMKDYEQWFDKGEGMTLQREDSDLAIAVLSRMESLCIVTLPVHDSFIVQTCHIPILRDAMDQEFKLRYGHSPEIH